MDNNAFTAYSNFFTHTQNMCYFLQSQVEDTHMHKKHWDILSRTCRLQVWQEDTEATIHSLASNSAKVQIINFQMR